MLGGAEEEELRKHLEGTDQRSRRKSGRGPLPNQRAFGDKEVGRFRCSRVIQMRAGQQHLSEPGGLDESHLKGKLRAEASVH